MTTFNGIDVFPNREFPYEPLVEAMGEIRVVALQPAQRYEEGIKCSLSHINILDCENPQHEALSYTWGDPNDLVDIAVNNVPFRVTKNLDRALRHLRLTDQSKMLWIDAICIDQNNSDEKSFQVSVMWATYSNALQTIVWIGEASKNSDLALQVIDDISSGVVDPIFDLEKIKENLRTHRPLTPLEGAKWAALVDLFARPWWQRIWVVQEVAFARRCIVVCGHRTLNWRSLKDSWLTIAFAADHSMLSIDEQAKIRNAKLIGGMEKWKPTEFGAVLSAARSSSATNLRDKVYGCLNLMRNNKSFEPRLSIDYSKSITEVYLDATMKLIDLDGDLRVLTLCEPDFELSRLTAFDNIQRYVVDSPIRPSWVPNFANGRSASPLWGSYEHGNNPSRSRDDYTGYYSPRYEPFRAGSIGAAKYRFADPNELIVMGVWVDLIKDVGEDIFDKTNVINVILAMNQVVMKQDVIIGGGGSSYTDAIWRTVTADRTIQGYRWPEGYDWEENKYSQEISDSIVRTNMGRVSIATKSGLIGLAPRGTIPADSIIIIPGLHVPLVVRAHRTWSISSGSCCQEHTELSICIESGCAVDVTGKELIASWYELIGEACM